MSLVSRASNSSISCERLTLIPFSFNWLCLLLALVSAVAVKNIFIIASGKIILPISLPSATNPGSLAKALCMLTIDFLRLLIEAIFEAVFAVFSLNISLLMFLFSQIISMFLETLLKLKVID